MERFWKSPWFVGLVFALLGLLTLFMMLQIKPLLIGIFKFLEAVLAPFFVALIVSYVLNPVVNVLSERRVPRTIAILLIYALFFALLTVIFMNLIPVFIKQLDELNEHLPELTTRVRIFVDGFNQNKFLPDSIRMGFNSSLLKMNEVVSQSISGYINSIGSTLNTLFVAFIVPFLAFYILKDFQLIERTALAIVPRSHRKEVVSLLIDIDTALGSYIRGQLLVCLIVGVFAYIGYWIIGMPYPLLLASIVAVFNIVPYLGPFLGAAPAMLMASTISFKLVILVAIVNTIIQIMEGNIISPQVVGRTLHMHPLTIIMVLLVGGEVWGMLGMILAVPFFAVLKVIVQHVFKYYVHRKSKRV
ncbi:AI-2E family transporter [Paenibacillus sp. N1-5-1-14]|uniref:AI-2E family transporter n=1 Tax=Paenibacillus radicibacter TaxID=2972488 RepID=UPI0021597F05|nr:AI-2E family transporter [Paenibacillus radicibacter]MCR8644083.1 AI-2E family transporter [Paenibacillus radicibacter]